MDENAARRRLDKKLDSLARDGEGSAGNARSFHKATRSYGKAIIDAALDDMAQDEAEATDPCVWCGEPCVSLCCSKACHDEAVKLGIIQANQK